MYILDQNNVGTMYYIFTDHASATLSTGLGSISMITDASGNTVQELSFDAWGKRRDPATWQPYATNATIPAAFIDRGFTFHEHLYPFTLINMNGRAGVYPERCSRFGNPLVGRFLSADPYIQAPDNPLNLNRSSYCLNNPLRYTDPCGEFLIEAMIIGGLANWIMSGCEFNWDGAASFAIGAAAGAAGAGAGYGMNLALRGSAGFASGSVTGATSGFAGGFVGGAGNAWANGANFGQGLTQGLIGGSIGALAGGAIGGLQGGAKAKELGLDYWTGKGTGTPVEMSADKIKLLPTEPMGEPTGITNTKQLTEHQIANYPGSEEYVQSVFYGDNEPTNPFINVLGYEVKNYQLYNKLYEPVYGATIPYQESMFGGLKSFIIISPNMVSWSGNLHAVLGHEIIHAFHTYTGFMARFGAEVSEYYAYSFSASVPHITQSEAAAVARSLFVGYPFSHNTVYPSWVPLFK